MINRVVLVGRLTRKPELRATNSGLSVISFSLAFDTRQKAEDGRMASGFINCTAFGKTAETISRYCDKGTQIGVDGSLNYRRYQRRDGTNAENIEVTVDQITLLGGKANGGEQQSYSRPNNSNVGYVEDEPFSRTDDITSGDGDLADDDLPF